MCTHVCTQDSGCVTKVLTCPHSHDDACGYAAGSPGAPCTFVCPICPIEDLIGRLPGSVSDQNIDQVQAQLSEIYALYDELTADEQQQVDLSPCATLLDQMYGMETAALNDTSSLEYNLDENRTINAPYVINVPATIVTNGYTLTVKNSTGKELGGIQVTGTGALEIIGKVTALNCAGVEVQSGGSLTIREPDTTINSTTYALDIASGAKVHLSAGTYSGKSGAIWMEDGDYSTLLEPGYIFVDSTGNPTSPENLAPTQPLTVRQCLDHLSKTYTHNATTHTWTCSDCKLTGTEPCTFDFAQNGIGTCACGNGITVTVNEDDLTNLVYDGTLKPEQVGVTVTLTDGSNKELVKGTDYKVEIEAITNAGRATVTVTGITFNGTFVRTYNVAKDVPDLSWDTAAKPVPVTVNYDGQPVEAGDLPPVKINIQSTVDDLRQYLQYSYKKQGDTDYIGGLPTDAGTYEVIVSLPELPNFTRATSAPITLTVNPINPIATAPAAKTLTYNRAVQELVTAGDLDPVAVADGLEIQFATSETGTYSAAIPTGTDAGNYTVCYQVTGLTDNYIAPNPNPAQVAGVEIQRKQIKPVVTLSQYTYLYDGGEKQPTVTVKDDDRVTDLPDTEYEVEYVNNRDVSTDANPAKVVVTDKIENGGNYNITQVDVPFQITHRTQEPALSITLENVPSPITYGDRFTLGTSGGSGNGLVTWKITNGTDVAKVDEHSGQMTILGDGTATVQATKSGTDLNGVTNYEDAIATWTLTARKKPVTATVTADDKPFDGNTTATVHATVEQGVLPGDEIKIENLTGTFSDANVGTDKTVTLTGGTVGGTSADKYDITIPSTTTASIHKATVTAPAVTGNNLTYTGSAQALVAGGDTNTLYSGTKDGVYSATVPTGTNAGTYTVWYKQQGDANHNDSAPQAIEVTISPKTLTATDITLSGNDLKTDTNGTCYYEYDGTDKEPTVTIKDGSAVIPASEYMVTYSDNKNVTTVDKKATVTITDNEGGNYTVSGSTTFEIRAASAVLTSNPQARNLTYTGQPQELVTVGTATGGWIEYKLRGDPDTNTFSKDIPTAPDAGTYTVDYKVVGDTNHTDGPTGSVTVTIQPKTVVSPKITVTGTYTYNGNEQKPTGTAVTVVDGDATIPDTEYTLSYRDNVNAGTATVIVTDNNGGNYTVNGTATFQIGKAAAAVGKAPTGKTGLHYNGSAQELITAGSSNDGMMVYALTEDGEYSAAIPIGKAVDTYTVYYKVQGDANHENSEAQSVTASIAVNTVTNPTIQVTPSSVKYTGEKQTPTVTVKDDSGLLIDGSEYKVAYSGNMTAVGTYTVTITEVTNGNYTFDATGGKNTAEFKILPADQTPLTITGTRERVCYGDTIQLGTTGGNGAVTWEVSDGSPATVGENTGLLKITGVGSVTVTATSKETGYADQTTTWNLYAEKKTVTALVTAASKAYDGNETAAVTATLQTSDFVGTDNFTITLAGCTFEDPNAGTDKKVNVVSTNPGFAVNAGGTDNHANYAITYPATATASIFKADVTDVTAPTLATGLKYTGLPQALVTAGSSTKGILEYSLDGTNYSSSLPTGTDAGDYDVWYRVKGDGNHNDTTGTKLTIDTNKLTIGQQSVANPTIELTPNSVSYDGKEHKPSVTVKDSNHRVIPAEEYTVTYSGTDWKTASSSAVKHEVTVTDKDGGNYTFTAKTAEFVISMMGQNPLSITNQPGEVRYGDSFTLSTTGGSGTGAVTWTSSDTSVATIGTNGLVKTLKSGATTITATKEADANYGAVSVTWALSVEKRPATAIVTANDRAYDASRTDAELVITWTPGDLLNGDTITLNLTGKFNNANVGDNKTVTISGDVPASDKYTISYNQTTTASITPAAASVTAPTPLPVEYSGQPQPLVNAGVPTNGTITYSLDGIVYGPNIPQGTNAGSYTVWYKVAGNENYKDIAPDVVPVTIQPKTVTNLVIELSPPTFDYDGTPKKPDVVVKDGSTVIPASEYTVSYSNNIAVGTATVTISDNTGGNYIVNGSESFTIKAGEATLTTAPQAKVLTYTGAPQELVSRGAAANGTVVYSQTETGSYTTTVPRQTNAGSYEVWYKVQNTDGTDATSPQYLSVTIARKAITAEVLLDPEEFTYSGDPCTPDVLVLDLDSNDFLDPDADYTVRYMSNTKIGTARVIVTGKGNYSFSVITTFEIVAAKAEFETKPGAITGLKYNGTAQALVSAGTAKNSGIVLYSLDNAAYSTAIPTAINRGSYTVYAKVQGSSNYEESDVVQVPVTIGLNTLSAGDLTVTLSTTNFPYTGGEVKPTVTVTDNVNGNVIDSGEYTVTYTNNVNVGTATVSIKSKTNGNYSFTASTTFTIVDASQTPLAITGKPEGTICYGDILSLGTTGGGSGAVTWSATGPVDKLADGQYKVTSSGSVTITATKGSYTDTWTFYAQPKPVTATVYAADKVYDGNNTAILTVALSGLVSGDVVDTVTATGQFTDETVGTNKTIIITGLTVPDAVSKKYDISYNTTTTASITPKPAAVQDANKPTLAGPLTYNGGAQALLTSGGTADGGNLMYSLDGREYSYIIPTGTDAKTYMVWYKVEASDDNHKDSAAVKLGEVTIAPNVDTPTVLCTPAIFQYDGTEKTPTVVVRDSAQRIIPESEYTVTLPSPRITVGTYKVTITDNPDGNYKFDSPVTEENAFEIVASSQPPLSIITDIPTDVHYGDTFRLSAMGGTGSGAIQWSIEGNESGTPATINTNGVVTVTGTGGFTVKAYRKGADGYSDSNTDSVPFEAKSKPVTPVVTANDKPYDGKIDATLTASWKSGDLVSGDTIAITATGTFATADAGTGKQVSVIGNATGTDTILAKYAITWPDSTTASIYKVDAKLASVPTGKTLTYKESAQELVSAGTTVNNIGTIVYSLNNQNGTYTESIPTAAAVDTYTVWYKVEDSVNYTGVAPAFVTAVITAAESSNDLIDTNFDESAGFSMREPEGANTGLSAADGDALVQEAIESQSETIVIQPEVASDATEAVLSIPVETVSRISSETNAALTVSTPIADVTIPNAGLETLSGQEGDVGVAVTRQEDGAVMLTLVSADGETVESIPGGVTLTVPAENAGPGTVAVLVNEDGTREIIRRSVAEDGKMNVPLNGSATVEIVDNSKSFDDVPSDSWAAEAITFASARELFGGTSETTFSPGQTMSRGMVATVLYRLEGQPDQAAASAYSDVGDDDWYADGVAWAAENGIVNGYGDGQFGPNDSVTREQFIVMLWRYVGSPEVNDHDLSFTDAAQVNSYALEAMCWAVENGVLSGNDSGQLVPGGTATRAEAAQMLKNFLENT